MSFKIHAKQQIVMKYFIAIALLFTFFTTAKGQEIEGNYKNESDSLFFSNGRVIFSISEFGALFTRMVGEGNYEQIGNYLLINTEDYSGKKTIHTTMDNNIADTLSIHITTLENYPVNGAMAELMSSSEKVLKRAVAGEDGKIYFQKNPKLMKKVSKAKISHMGYNQIIFDCNNDQDHLVKLAKNDVIENRTIVFELADKEDETLSIVLLCDDFNPGKDRMKTLNKLKQQAKSKNKLSKRYKKEYIPTYYNR